MTDHFVELSIVLPCRNEEDGLRDLLPGLRLESVKLGRSVEVIVVNSMSTDASAEVATSYGARVVFPTLSGYGAACQRGIDVAHGNAVVVADCDGTYSAEDIISVAGRLMNSSCDLVRGTRPLRGAMRLSNMPITHRLANRTLSLLVSFILQQRVNDCTSGLFAIRTRLRVFDLGKGAEFNVNLLLSTVRSGGCVHEVPIQYHSRIGTSKLRPLRDGLRILRTILRGLAAGGPRWVRDPDTGLRR